MNRLHAFENVGRSFNASPVDTASSGELDITALWQAYSVSRDESLRNRLLLHYLPISRMIARHLHGRMPAAVDLDDLNQAAALGMRSAIASYDIARGIPFEHYCGPRVRGAVLDHLRSLDWAPRMLRTRLQRLQETTRQMEMETGLAPSDEEVSAAMNVPLEEIRTLRSEALVPVRIQQNTLEEEGAAGAVNLDTLPDHHGYSPLVEAQRADLRDFVVKGLNPAERQVLILYYYENMSLREIGETLGLCESRVSQIHQSVIKRLRERMDRIGGPSMDE